MKDTREAETQEDIKVIQSRGWCACAILWIWDCLKAMGRGFQFDNENTHQRPRGRG